MKKVALTVVALSMAGCDTTKEYASATNQAIGGVVGAVAGGLVGSQIGSGRGKTVATIAGALIGAGVGSQIARYLTEQDRQMVDQTAQSALSAPPGPTYTWTNPDTGNSGTITTTPISTPAATTTTPITTATTFGSECRVIESSYSTTGGVETAPPQTVCKDADGVWQVT